MKNLRHFICFAALLALASCSVTAPERQTSAPPPDQILEPAPASESKVTIGGEGVSPGPEPLIFAAPDAAESSDLGQTGLSSERKQADTEACYRFARAQVDKDIRIDDDIASARGDAFSQHSRLIDFNRRVDSFYYEKQRTVRFENCMRSKGYFQN